MMVGSMLALCALTAGGELAEEPRYGTHEAAALAAQQSLGIGAGEAIDVQRTLRLLRDPSHWRAIDLDADGDDEFIAWVGDYINAAGEPMSMDGATGNRAWTIIERLGEGPDFQYRVVTSGYGFTPDVLPTRDNGWSDLLTGGDAGGKAGALTLLRYDGSAYQGAWSTSVEGLGDPCFIPQAVPIDTRHVVRGFLEARFGQAVPEFQVLDGAAFSGDFDGDGLDDLMLQINRIQVGDTEIGLQHDASAQRPNFAYFASIRRAGGFRLKPVFTAPNHGPLHMPMHGENETLCFITQTTDDAGKLRQHTWTVRAGKLIPTK